MRGNRRAHGQEGIARNDNFRENDRVSAVLRFDQTYAKHAIRPDLFNFRSERINDPCRSVRVGLNLSYQGLGE